MKKFIFGLVYIILAAGFMPHQLCAQGVIIGSFEAKDPAVTENKTHWNNERLIMKNTKSVAKEIRIYSVDPMTIIKVDPVLLRTDTIAPRGRLILFCDPKMIYLYTLSDDDHKEFFQYE